jgi:hypothetical protein
MDKVEPSGVPLTPPTFPHQQLSIGNEGRMEEGRKRGRGTHGGRVGLDLDPRTGTEKISQRTFEQSNLGQEFYPVHSYREKQDIFSPLPL